MTEITIIPGKFYLLDNRASFLVGRAVIVAGPFDTKDEAEDERRQINIGDDCSVVQRLVPVEQN